MNNNVIVVNSNAFEEFNKQLDAYGNKLRNTLNGSELKGVIAEDFKKLTLFYSNLCDDAINPIALPQDTYLYNYILSEIFKDLLILHRDVFLELHKVFVYDLENQITDTQITNYFSQSKTILENALESFSNTTIHEHKKLNKDTKIIQKIKRKLTLHNNPWNIYKTQYGTLLQQINHISATYYELIRTSETFEKLKNVLKKVSNNHNDLIIRSIQVVQYLSESIKEKADVLSYIDENLHNQLITENNHQLFTVLVNNEIKLLSRIDVPIAFYKGQLSVREIDFNKRVQKWFDYQILPSFLDLIGIEANLINKHNLNLINLKNNIQLLKNNNEEKDYKVVLNSLSTLQEEIINLKGKGEHITDVFSVKVNEQLLVSNLIKGLPFLEVPINSSLSIEGSTLLLSIKESLKKGGAHLNLRYKKQIDFETLSNKEISAECIAHRMYQDENSHYDSLFLSKKFIGDLFLIARKEQEAKLKQIINQWQDGFNKSVLVVGDRLCGRSTFIDYTSKKFFKKHIVTLQPNKSATIDGRKFSTTFNLKEALDYVKNNNIKSTKPAILIDDLELWRDKDYSLLTNIRALVDFIETESDKVFIIVSTTTQMQSHLDYRFDFSNRFSNVINCNIANKEEIIEAIQLRHDAAHRDLVTEDLEIMSNYKMRNIARNLCKQTSNNFGNTLQSWTYKTFVQEDEKVLFKESHYEFLDFFTQQEHIILKQALIYKKISEFGLKRLIANAYDTNYKSSLRRLINIKILIRDTDGDLYINPVVVNDISRIIITN